MMSQWEAVFEKKIIESYSGPEAVNDPAHDLAHFRRVVSTAKRLTQAENGRLEIVLPAAWLHDLVNVPKNDPRRSQASRLSAQAALSFLQEVGYPADNFKEIGHAIEAHSFSARITPTTLEAKIVQDADRLDGLGAIGIARVFAVSGLLQRRLYQPEDPFGASGRPLDDLENTVDHFFVKLFKTVDTLQTAAGRAEGAKRAEHMRLFLKELGREIGVSAPNF